MKNFTVLKTTIIVNSNIR